MRKALHHRIADFSGFPALGGQLQALRRQLFASVCGGLLEREIDLGLFARGLGRKIWVSGIG